MPTCWRPPIKGSVRGWSVNSGAPSPEELHRLLRYDPETGKLYWRARPESMFTTSSAALRWNSRFAGQEAITATSSGYRIGWLLSRRVKAHRVIWAMFHGEWPEMIDHINGNPSDNRLENLRAATRAENAKNSRRPSNNKSGAVGVHWHQQARRWSAQIAVNGSSKHLGNFTSFNEAVAARRAAEAEHGFHENHGRDA